MALLGLNGLPGSPKVPGISETKLSAAGYTDPEASLNTPEFGLLLRRSWDGAGGLIETISSQTSAQGAAGTTLGSDLGAGQAAPMGMTAAWSQWLSQFPSGIAVDGEGGLAASADPLLIGDELLAGLRTKLQDPDLRLDDSILDSLMAWLDSLPPDQADAVWQWLQGGNLMPEAANALLDTEPAHLGGDAGAILEQLRELAVVPVAPAVAAQVAGTFEEVSQVAGEVVDPETLPAKFSVLDGVEQPMPRSLKAQLAAAPPIPAGVDWVESQADPTDPATETAGVDLGQEMLPTQFSSGGSGSARDGAGQAATAAPRIPTPVGHPSWNNALGERVLWMLGKDIQSAEIHLNPPDLGPVEIRVMVNNDQATVSFTASHALTRDALESAIPRLREMLAENQLTLTQASVSQQDGGQSQAQAQQGQGSGQSSPGTGWDSGEEDPDAALALAQTRTTLVGLIDDFA